MPDMEVGVVDDKMDGLRLASRRLTRRGCRSKLRRQVASPLVYRKALLGSTNQRALLEHPILVDNFLHKVLPSPIPDFQRRCLLLGVRF